MQKRWDGLGAKKVIELLPSFQLKKEKSKEIVIDGE